MSTFQTLPPSSTPSSTHSRTYNMGTTQSTSGYYSTTIFHSSDPNHLTTHFLPKEFHPQDQTTAHPFFDFSANDKECDLDLEIQYRPRKPSAPEDEKESSRPADSQISRNERIANITALYNSTRHQNIIQQLTKFLGWSPAKIFRAKQMSNEELVQKYHPDRLYLCEIMSLDNYNSQRLLTMSDEEFLSAETQHKIRVIRDPRVDRTTANTIFADIVHLNTAPLSPRRRISSVGSCPSPNEDPMTNFSPATSHGEQERTGRLITSIQIFGIPHNVPTTNLNMYSPFRFVYVLEPKVVVGDNKIDQLKQEVENNKGVEKGYLVDDLLLALETHFSTTIPHLIIRQSMDKNGDAGCDRNDKLRLGTPLTDPQYGLTNHSVLIFHLPDDYQMTHKFDFQVGRFVFAEKAAVGALNAATIDTIDTSPFPQPSESTTAVIDTAAMTDDEINMIDGDSDVSTVQIQVSTLNKETITLTVKLSDTILHIKTLIRDNYDATPEFQRIIFSSKELPDDNLTLAECNIEKDSKLFMILRHRDC